MLCLESVFVQAYFTINTTQMYALFSVAMNDIQESWHAMHVQTLSDPTVSHTCRVRCMRSVTANISTAHTNLEALRSNKTLLYFKVLKSSDSGPTHICLRVFEEWRVVRNTAGSTNETQFYL